MANCSQLMIQEPACKVPKYLTNDFEEPFQVQAGCRAPLVHCYAYLGGGRFAHFFCFMSSLLDCEIPKTVFESTMHSLAVSHTWPGVCGVD